MNVPHLNELNRLFLRIFLGVLAGIVVAAGLAFLVLFVFVGVAA